MSNRDKKMSVNDEKSLDARGFVKELNSDIQEDADEIRKKYMDGPDEPGENVHVRHPNRNTDKPDIDKPPYS